jgi:hypothetical protein
VPKNKPQPVVKQNKPVERLPLSSLELDITNPRFGEGSEKFANQAAVVDWIVERFGVEDVISSLAINGYFDAEPLIVSPHKGTNKWIVKEGNRRLAACLILAKDERAKNHWRKADALVAAGHDRGWTSSTEVPTIKFSDAESAELLSYLGVRHIVSAQPWDSYAKAAWISSVTHQNHLTIDEISDVIGDKNKTISRLLEGYNFVKQLVESGHFDPKSSLRRGRGSNTEYPFSWVYTLLGYGPVREWLGLSAERDKNKPVAEDKIDDAALTLRYMFGDKNKGMQPAITDSREIGDLAVALGNQNKRALLRNGYTVTRIEVESQPIADRLSTQYLTARDLLRDANGLLAETDIGTQEATDLMEIVKTIRKQASESYKTLNGILSGEDEE